MRLLSGQPRPKWRAAFVTYCAHLVELISTVGLQSVANVFSYTLNCTEVRSGLKERSTPPLKTMACTVPVHACSDSSYITSITAYNFI